MTNSAEVTMGVPSGVRVLVADDDADIRELVAFKLRGAGYSVDLVGDGQAAWEKFEAAPPQLVVLDIQMPHMSGIEVLRRIRAGDTANVPVMLLSARSRDSDVEVGLAAGANAYLIKPFSPRELLRRVNELISVPPASSGAGPC